MTRWRWTSFAKVSPIRHHHNPGALQVTERSRIQLPISYLLAVVVAVFSFGCWATELHMEMSANTDAVADVKADVKELKGSVALIDHKVDLLMASKSLPKIVGAEAVASAAVQ